MIFEGNVLCNGDPISVLSHPDARELYFGEKSQQQLENLMKKIQGRPIEPETESPAPRRRERFFRSGNLSEDETINPSARRQKRMFAEQDSEDDDGFRPRRKRK